MFKESVAGKTVWGLHKRANKKEHVMGVEVTAHLTKKDKFGKAVPYLFGTRVDPTNPGAVVMVRADCFLGEPTIQEPTGEFKAITDLDKWYVTFNDAAFAPLEYVESADIAKYAIERGGEPVANLVVAL